MTAQQLALGIFLIPILIRKSSKYKHAINKITHLPYISFRTISEAPLIHNKRFGPWRAAVELVLKFDKFADDFFGTRPEFEKFYQCDFRSIVNSEILFLQEYFQDMEEHLPAEYRINLVSDVRGQSASGDPDLDEYRENKHELFAQLEACDLFMVLGGLYDL